MTWLSSNWAMLMTILLVVSETAAAIVQLAFPNNKGVAGFIAGLIKFLQNLGAKEPDYSSPSVSGQSVKSVK